MVRGLNVEVFLDKDIEYFNKKVAAALKIPIELMTAPVETPAWTSDNFSGIHYWGGKAILLGEELGEEKEKEVNVWLED